MTCEEPAFCAERTFCCRVDGLCGVPASIRFPPWVRGMGAHRPAPRGLPERARGPAPGHANGPRAGHAGRGSGATERPPGSGRAAGAGGCFRAEPRLPALLGVAGVLLAIAGLLLSVTRLLLLSVTGVLLLSVARVLLLIVLLVALAVLLPGLVLVAGVGVRLLGGGLLVCLLLPGVVVGGLLASGALRASRGVGPEDEQPRRVGFLARARSHLVQPPTGLLDPFEDAGQPRADLAGCLVVTVDVQLHDEHPALLLRGDFRVLDDGAVPHDLRDAHVSNRTYLL